MQVSFFGLRSSLLLSIEPVAVLSEPMLDLGMIQNFVVEPISPVLGIGIVRNEDNGMLQFIKDAQLKKGCCLVMALQIIHVVEEDAIVWAKVFQVKVAAFGFAAEFA